MLRWVGWIICLDACGGFSGRKSVDSFIREVSVRQDRPGLSGDSSILLLFFFSRWPLRRWWSILGDGVEDPLWRIRQKWCRIADFASKIRCVILWGLRGILWTLMELVASYSDDWTEVEDRSGILSSDCCSNIWRSFQVLGDLRTLRQDLLTATGDESRDTWRWLGWLKDVESTRVNSNRSSKDLERSLKMRMIRSCNNRMSSALYPVADRC